jgi:acyl carrier protein
VTKDDIRKLALDILAGIAPEADFEALGEDEVLREVLDLDSMDFLNFVASLHQATGAELPEADYRLLSTLGGVVDYLSETRP